MLQDAADAMVRFQDRQTGMFWQVVDKPGVPGNYLETSGSALFAYAMLKGVRLGVLPARYFSEPVVENDAKGVGLLLLAYTELLAEQANR